MVSVQSSFGYNSSKTKKGSREKYEVGQVMMAVPTFGFKFKIFKNLGKNMKSDKSWWLFWLFNSNLNFFNNLGKKIKSNKSWILNLNPKVGTAIMTCPTSYFSPIFKKNWIWIKKLEQPSWLVRLHYFPQNFKNFEFESKSRNSHHDLSDFIIFPNFLRISNLN